MGSRFALAHRVNLRAPARGFALVALLIAVAIIGLGTASTATVATLARRRAAEEQLLYVGDQYRRAIAAYVGATPLGQPRYPAQLADLLKDPRYPTTRRYLRSLAVDPVTGRDDWVPILAPEGGIMGVRSVSTRVPIKREGFDTPYQAFTHGESYAAWQFCFPDCPPLSK